MSQLQAISALSHGLIVTAGPTTFPDPYDVRYGVDNGNGELGTLTSPTTANVRSGIQYGGDGDQYTGVLYVPSANGGNTWNEEMRDLFYDEVSESEFGVTASYNGAPFQCIKTPVRSGFQATLNVYEKQADSIIDMWRTDAITNELYALVQPNPQSKRPVIVIGAQSFQVLKLENDNDTNPVIRFSVTLLQ